VGSSRIKPRDSATSRTGELPGSLATRRPKAGSGKCERGSIDTGLQGWKMRDKQVWTAKSAINMTYL